MLCFSSDELRKISTDIYKEANIGIPQDHPMLETAISKGINYAY